MYIYIKEIINNLCYHNLFNKNILIFFLIRQRELLSSQIAIVQLTDNVFEDFFFLIIYVNCSIHTTKLL